MQEALLSKLFVRFRDRRDGRALAAVFDATARELLEVAAHLVPSVDEAEDVVQTTFQRMIERAASFDGSRSLKAWAYGILWREAAKLRRSEARRVDPELLAARGGGDPLEELAAGELPDELRRALERVPAPYREVLEPILCEERTTREVARALGRSPGTVRVHLQRGLERLRRSLPEDARSGGLLALLPGSGLAELRARVLGHAGVAPAAVPAASFAFLAVQLASVAALTAPAVAAAGAVLALGGFALQRTLAPSAQAVGAPALAGLGSEPALLAAPLADPAAGQDERRPVGSAAGAAQSNAGTAPRGSAEIGEPDVRGLVTDEGGAPLAGLSVRARRDSDERFPIELVTDGEGRFAAHGLEPGWWFFSVDDARYARMWWRKHGAPVDVPEHAALEERELVLVLHAPHRVEAQVVDRRGKTVEGVRATLAVEWIEGEERPVQGHLTNELAVRTTDGQGRFALDRLARGRMSIVLDHPRFARTVAHLDVPARGPVELRIEDGLVLEGRVVHHGAPLAGVRVVAGSPIQSRLPMGRWEVETGADGRFRCEHVPSFPEFPDQGLHTVSVGIDDEAWTSDHYGVFESPLGLPQLEIEAHPRTAGVERGSVCVGPDPDKVVPGGDVGSGVEYGTLHVRVDLGGALLAEPRPIRLAALSEAVADIARQESTGPDGTLTFDVLPPGRYRVAAWNLVEPNLLPQEVELGSGETVAVVLRPGTFTLRGMLRCEGLAVSTGRVDVRRTRGEPSFHASGTIGDGGAYAVPGLEPGTYELLMSAPDALTWIEELVVEGDTWHDVELPRGRIEGRFWGLVLPPPRAGYHGRIHVFPYGFGPESGNRGVFLEPDAEGRFTARHLPPGDYLVRMGFGVTDVPLSVAVVTISAAAPVQQAEIAPLTRTGRVAGRITNLAPPGRRGRPTGPMACLLVRESRGLRPENYVEVDERTGAFEFGPVGTGTYALLVGSYYGGETPFVLLPRIEVVEGATADLAVELPASREVAIHLESSEWTPVETWRLRLPSGDWLPFVSFVGSEPEGRRAGPGPFRLPYGAYAVEADFGDGAPIVRELAVEPGEGVLEVSIERP